MKLKKLLEDWEPGEEMNVHLLPASYMPDNSIIVKLFIRKDQTSYQVLSSSQTGETKDVSGAHIDHKEVPEVKLRDAVIDMVGNLIVKEVL